MERWLVLTSRDQYLRFPCGQMVGSDIYRDQYLRFPCGKMVGSDIS